jgi:hypothetical protein
MYRADNGDKCAIGALIPDSMYVKATDKESGMEGKLVDSLIEMYPEVKLFFQRVDIGLLISLQSVHDYWHNASQESLCLDLTTIAEIRGLIYDASKYLHPTT